MIKQTLAVIGLFFTLNVQAAPLPADSLYSDGDLIAMHYDSCPDPDDIHAAVAGRMVLDFYELEQGNNYIVSNGACGEDRPRSDYIQNSPEIFNFLYGSVGSDQTWLNVFDSYQSSVNTSANRWRQVLDAGNIVWVAEGGPGDYTSDIVRALQASGFSGNLKNIRVIQHSGGFNVSETNDQNIAFVRQVTDFIQIPNGNIRGNGTGGFHQSLFNAAQFLPVNPSLVQRFRDNATYGPAWNEAFRLFNPTPSTRFDFSDTVAVLHILGLDGSDTPDISGFADFFLVDTNDTNPVTPVPVIPVAPTPTPPISNDPNRIIVSAPTIREAQQIFRDTTNLRRVDCDFQGGLWLCASFNNPTLADLNQTPVVPEPVTPTPVLPSTPEPVTPTVPTPVISDPSRVVVIGNNLSLAKQAFALVTDLRRVDCDPVSGGRWICASYNNPQLSDLDSPQIAPVPEPVSIPTVTPEPVSVPTDSALLNIQAENGIQVSGTGWQIESALPGAQGSYIVWRGNNNFTLTGDEQPAGVLAYDFTVTEAGVYQIAAQTHARIGNPNGTSDSDNDFFVRFTSGSNVSGLGIQADQWLKAFTVGETESWRPYNTGQLGQAFTPIQRTLSAGTHRVLIGGRSQRFGIDYVGLTRIR